LPATPTLSRRVVSAIAVLALALALWFYVDRRSAPPPPPKVTLPAR
jgi:hypothetical protein